MSLPFAPHALPSSTIACEDTSCLGIRDFKVRISISPPIRERRCASLPDRERVKLAFDQIRQASATTSAVLIRQLESIRRLAPRLPEACRQGLSDQADAILETEPHWSRSITATLSQPGTGPAQRPRRCPALEWMREHTRVVSIPGRFRRSMMPGR